MQEEYELLPTDRQPAIRVLAMPADTNARGDIFGGWIMSQVDIAGSVAAHKAVDGRVVTVAVNSFQFRKPVFVGDLISCYAEITRIGRTSITAVVEVIAERERLEGRCIKVTEATLTYVAVDDQGRPRPIDPDSNP